MKTTVKWASALALGAAAWKICRDRKYPLAKGCPPMNLFVVPGGALNPGVAALGNRVLARMPLPPVMPGLRRSRQTVQVPGGQEVPLTLYEPEGAAAGAASGRMPRPWKRRTSGVCPTPMWRWKSSIACGTRARPTQRRWPAPGAASSWSG